MSVISLFPTQIFSAKLPAKTAQRLNSDILRDIPIIRRLDREGREWSRENYVGGYTSYSSIADVHRRFGPFMELKEHLDKQLKSYLKTLKPDLMGRKVEMTTCWINVMPSLVHHSLHLHPLCFISGTYYVQTPPGSGDLKIEDPRLGLFMAAPPKKGADKPFFKITPQSGQVLMWESWLRHEVTANRGRGQRVSVSFNYEWV